jgi:adenylosuccinate lyase
VPKNDSKVTLTMELNQLTAISPLDGRYREKVAELSPYISEMALIKTRIEVEAKYLIALSEAGLVRKLTVLEKKFLFEFNQNITDEQVLKVKEFEEITRHDVKAVEKFLREILEKNNLKDLLEWIHFGLTSEDINNIARRLMLIRAIKEVIVPTLDLIVDELVGFSKQNKAISMLARTHGQPAVPTTLGKEMVNFAMRINGQIRKLEIVKLEGKLNGAVGNYNALQLSAPGIDWVEFSRKFITSLGLIPNLITTQINPYEDIIETLQIIQRINGIVLDLDQDIWRYVSDGWFIQIVKKREVGSSTMPQKVNPIDFENSEGNVQIANSLFEGMVRKLAVSRLQRDLSDSTTVRNIGAGLAYSLLAYKSTLNGLSRVHPNIELINNILNENWTILTEGVQTILRKEGVKDPYSLITSLSKGKHIGESEWQAWIDRLDIQDSVKIQLKNLSPESYLGKAVELTELAIALIKKSR